MIDTHAHYNDEAFDNDRNELLMSMTRQGIKYIINNGDSIKGSQESIALSEKYPFVYATVGVHPHNANEFSNDTYEKLKKMTHHKKVVAIGEIGLDYHYEFSEKAKQKEVFAKQLNLAREVNRRAVIHEREAFKDCFDILKVEKVYEVGAVMHCFSGDVNALRMVLELGIYISLGGTVTFKNAIKTVEAAKYIPLEYLMLETDCPYLTPVPNRGKRNDSSYMHFVAERIAQIRGITTEELIKATTKNAKRFYGIK